MQAIVDGMFIRGGRWLVECAVACLVCFETNENLCQTFVLRFVLFGAPNKKTENRNKKGRVVKLKS